MKVLHVVVLISIVYLIAVNDVALSGPVRPGTRTCPAPTGTVDCRTVRVANTCTTDAECSRVNAGYKCCKQQCGNLACTAPVVACEPVYCKMSCADGYVKDKYNCDTCECNPPPSACDPEVMCMMFCPQDQYKYDANGCRLCECAWANKHRFGNWTLSTQSYCTFERTR